MRLAGRVGCGPTQGSNFRHCPRVERVARIQNDLAGLLIGRRVPGHGALGERPRRPKPVFRAEICRRFLATKELNFIVHEHHHDWVAKMLEI
jgi:hypothetical protein